MKQLDSKTVTESEYYYQCPFDTWDQMSYPQALVDRNKRVKETWEMLYQDQIKNGKNWTFDQKVRFFKVEKAVKDNQQLIDERSNLI